MLDPTSRPKQIWDAATALMLVATAVAVPLRLTLRLEDPWLDALEWAITLMFCADLLLNFFTAQRVRGKLIQDRASIARRYLRGWFAVDLLAALPFGVFVSGGHLATGAQLVRLLRLLRLLRLAHLMQIWQRAWRFNPAVLRLMFFAFWVFLAAHWISCGWIALHGASAAPDDRTLMYLRALYWAVTTLTTVGYGDVTPSISDPAQLVYTMFVMVIGVAIYGYIIGNVASMLAKMDVARANHQAVLDRVDAFMKHRGLSRGLQERIHAYYDYIWAMRRGYDDRSVLRELPRSLHVEVALELNQEMLSRVPIFAGCGSEVIRELVIAMEPVVYGPGDFVVRRGDAAHDMFFIAEGVLEVLGEDGATVYKRLQKGDFFGEIGLLTSQPRTASIRAVDYCDLFRLDRATVERTIKHHPRFAEQMRQQAARRLHELGTESGRHVVPAEIDALWGRPPSDPGPAPDKPA